MEEFETYLTEGKVRFDASDAALLRAIAEHGSVSAAARELGRSRARAGRRLDALESAFGELVERKRGGADGGGTRLTDEGATLLARFDRRRDAHAALTEATETVLDGAVVDRTGELAVVETPAGTLRAVCPPDATAVVVTVRADAVTLHAPAASPDEDATSARNHLRGTVEAVERGTALARVTVAVGETTLVALLTAESVARLELTQGSPVTASVKATATRATPR